MTWLEIIIRFLIPLLCAIMTYHIVPLLKEKKLYEYIKIGVYAAEQLFKETGMGKEKYAYAKDWAKSKFNISDEDLERLIESIVFEMQNSTS